MDSGFNRNENQKPPRGEGPAAHKADGLTATCEPVVKEILAPPQYEGQTEIRNFSVSRRRILQLNAKANEPVRFEVSTAVIMKKLVFWDVTSCGSCKNQRFGRMYRLHYQDERVSDTSN
jgi:hypothetical protein